jgi:redox-sensitive bicupin YhaK (pirin superfamily)
MNIIRANERQALGHGAFQIRRLHPGIKLGNPDDLGFGPLGLIDHANLGPGLLVPMHEHRNDEILSYLRSGTLWHEDTHGGRLPMSATQLVVMNAGSGISHEESIPDDGESVEMLQIFIRPSEANLTPNFQSHRFESATSNEEWRLIAGPAESNAPLPVRNRVWVYDRRIASGAIDVPIEPKLDALLYVFSGAIKSAGDSALSAGDSFTVAAGDEMPELVALKPSDLVLFRVDRQAAFSRAGTLSG